VTGAAPTATGYGAGAGAPGGGLLGEAGKSLLVAGLATGVGEGIRAANQPDDFEMPADTTGETLARQAVRQEEIQASKARRGLGPGRATLSRGAAGLGRF
jgi:hypothetical protein